MGDHLTRNKDVVRVHFRALSSGDAATFEATHDPAGMNHAPGPFDLSLWPDEGRPFGPAEALETFEWLRTAIPDIDIVVEDLTAEGDQVIAWVRFSGTQTGPLGPIPPSHKRVDFCHAHRFRLCDGRIVEHWAIRDDLRGMLQMGVVQPPERP